MTRLLSSLVPAHVSGLDWTPAITSVLSLIAALSLFSIRDHSYLFTLVKLSCSRLSDSQGKVTQNVRGAEKRKNESLPLLYYSEQINEY